MLELNIPKLKEHLNDPLYKNSFFLVVSRVLNTGAGFLFWLFAARLYPIEIVGLSVALLSSLDLVRLFSTLGFNSSLIRFMPIIEKSKVLNTCLIITTISSFLIGLLYILGTMLFPTILKYEHSLLYSVIFLFFAVMNSLALVTSNAFLAIRKGVDYFWQNILMAVRIPLLLPFIALKSMGIFGAVGLAYIISSLFGLLRLNKYIGLNFQLDRQFVKDSLVFSSGNYVAEVLYVAPTLLLPILIVNLLGEAPAAQFYIAFAVGNMVLIIPDAIGTSLFVEGSHGENLRKSLTKSVIAVYAVLVPAVIIIYLLGGYVLSFFGRNYAEAEQLLRILVLSSLIVVAYFLFIPLQNVRMRVNRVIAINLARFVLLLGLSYFFMIRYGITGFGYAWMLTHLALLLGILLSLFGKEGLLRKHKHENIEEGSVNEL